MIMWTEEDKPGLELVSGERLVTLSGTEVPGSAGVKRISSEKGGILIDKESQGQFKPHIYMGSQKEMKTIAGCYSNSAYKADMETGRFQDSHVKPSITFPV